MHPQSVPSGIQKVFQVSPLTWQAQYRASKALLQEGQSQDQPVLAASPRPKPGRRRRPGTAAVRR